MLLLSKLCRVIAAGALDWQLVRHTPGPAWHPATDSLLGTAVYGDPAQTAQPFSVAWNIDTVTQVSRQYSDANNLYSCLVHVHHG